MLGGLKNAVLFLDAAVIGVFNLDEQQTVGMQIDLRPDLPPGGSGAQAGFQRVFQQVGQRNAHVDFIYRDLHGQVGLRLEGDAFTPGKGAIIADNAVRGAVFTKMHIQIWNPFNSSRYIFLYLIPLAAFRQCGNLVEMMPHVVACLARILDGGFQVFIALPLHGKKVVFLL